MIYAWTIPKHALELCMELVLVLVEVVIYTIEVGTWSAIESRILLTLDL
jgi:hypothetical protein